jgi:hypothetical protein
MKNSVRKSLGAGTRHTSLFVWASVVSVTACAPWPQNRPASFEPTTPRWLTVAFDSPRMVTSVPSLIASRDTWHALPNVVGIGGEVLDHRADSVLVRPMYIITRDARSARPALLQRRLWSDEPLSMPNVLVATSEPGTTVRPYEFPQSRRQRISYTIAVYAFYTWIVRTALSAVTRDSRW